MLAIISNAFQQVIILLAIDHRLAEIQVGSASGPDQRGIGLFSGCCIALAGTKAIRSHLLPDAGCYLITQFRHRGKGRTILFGFRKVEFTPGHCRVGQNILIIEQDEGIQVTVPCHVAQKP